MKSFIKNTIVFTLLYLLAGCTKDFLNDNLDQVPITAGVSNIYISPNWQSSDYAFKLPSVKDADFEIISKPSWLNIESLAGTLVDSEAIIQCSATKNTAFNKAGIYIDFITVLANEKNYKVPVGYITEGNPKVQIQNTQTLYFNTYGFGNLLIQNIGPGVLLWKISSMPNWLVLDTARIELNGIYISPYTSYNIPLHLKTDNVSSGLLSGTIVLTTNDSEHPSVTINVTYNLGTPQLGIYTSTINFSFTEVSKTLSFSNYGTGNLIWKFTDIPEWLTISPSNGICSAYSSPGNIILTCDRTKLSPGQNSATINLITNDNSQPSYSISVIAVAPGVSANLKPIEGNIIDVVFNKSANVLYYVVSSPNKFVAYDVINRTVLNEISLSKAPTCFAISEDWTKAAVGHNGNLSAINLSSNTVTATYSLDYSVYDIAWAENDWFSYTQNGGSFSALHWINISNGDKYDDTDKYSLDGSSIIKKVPSKAYHIATRNGTSPSGFFAYDIPTKSKKSYSHMDLNNFWFSEDGDYIFAKSSNVYRTTSSTGSTNTFNADINAIGKINTGVSNYYGLQFVYHGNNYLWVLQNETYSSESSTTLYQIEDNDYTLVKKYDYDLIYQPDAQTTPFSLRANYVFANNEGTEIAVICKGISNSSWIIQFIPVQ